MPGGYHAVSNISVYPHGNVRRAMDGTYSYLHRDQLGSVRAITDAAGVHAKQSINKEALRSDPCGASEQTPDRHGTAFQIVTGSGNWWSDEARDGEIRARLHCA